MRSFPGLETRASNKEYSVGVTMQLLAVRACTRRRGEVDSSAP